MRLWHVSEDGAIDDEHLPAYWFPRDCPRGTFWAVDTTEEDDVEHFLSGDRTRRVHALQSDWLRRFRAARVFAYRLPAEQFERYVSANGYWVSREAVEPLEVVELGDLLARRSEAGIELRIIPDLGALWARLPRASRSAASACATSDGAVGQTRCLTPDMSARGRVAQSGCGGALWKERHTFGAVSDTGRGRSSRVRLGDVQSAC